ncbi:hypothetical protein ACIGEZ_03435 [Streptomyces sp. NPDC085481]|uniref:hypothetical protein n=1 Tax=Streptomyces sp. NPDC085481 TaxID=3365727 RepID=UPI0037D23F0E
MTVQSIARRRVAQLIEQADVGGPAQVVKQMTQALLSDPDTDIEVTFPRASELLEIYTHRFESLPEFRESRIGWDSLFSALRRTEGRVGLLSVISEPWRAIVILNESAESVLACLIRVPGNSPRSAV